jgi:hypothetical protein
MYGRWDDAPDARGADPRGTAAGDRKLGAATGRAPAEAWGLPPWLCHLRRLLHPCPGGPEPWGPRAQRRQQLPIGVQRLWVLLRQQPGQPASGDSTGGLQLPAGLPAVGELLRRDADTVTGWL